MSLAYPAQVENMDNYSVRERCKNRGCDRLATSGNFCLDGRSPDGCVSWIDIALAKPKIKCGKCHHIGAYREFRNGRGRHVMEHPDYHYCPGCGHCIDHPVRVERDGRLYYMAGYVQVKEGTI